MDADSSGGTLQEQPHSQPCHLEPHQEPQSGVQPATWHMGVVAVLKKSYGFIRSAHCRGDVFFHSSRVVATPGDAPSAAGRTADPTAIVQADASTTAPPASSPADLAVGTVVSFTLDPAATAGKLTAASVRILAGTGACTNPLELVSNSMLVGRVSRPCTPATDGLVRYMEEGVVVKHLSFRASAAAVALGLKGVGVLHIGTPVTFRILTDLKQLRAAQKSTSPHAWHAAHRATDVAVLADEDKAALPAAARQQLLTLELLSSAFDPSQQ